MAATGTALWPGASTFPGTGVFPGQGASAIIRARFSFDDAGVENPTWSNFELKMREYEVTRGRGSEEQEFDTGNATALFDNNNRALDPSASVHPRNQFWLYEEGFGEIHDLFKGYVDSYTRTYDRSNRDAVVSITASDELSVLASDALPVTNPPRNSYGDLVMFDKPNNYWKLDDPDGTLTFKDSAENGMELTVFGGSYAIADGGAIVGDSLNRYLQLSSANLQPAEAPFQGQGGDAAGLTSFTIEAWVSVSDLSASNTVMTGPLPVSGSRQYWLKINTSGSVELQVQTSVASYTATGGSVIPNRFYHLVGVLDANTATLFINGSQVASVVTSGAVITGYNGALSPANARGMWLANNVGTTAFDEAAFYRYGLDASRIGAHYEAGTQRGFASELSGARIRNVLVASTSNAPRELQTGVRTVAPRYMSGNLSGQSLALPSTAANPPGTPASSSTSPKDAIAEALAAEAVDTAYYITASGAHRFLASNHRSSSPYNTVQATFGDAGGSELRYLAFSEDDSLQFLGNYWAVTRDGGETQIAFDQASIDAHRKAAKSLDGLALTSDGDSATVAAAMLAKYKETFQRVTSIEPDMSDSTTAQNVYRRELMDRIRFLHTPPGGGARTDQTLFVQSIRHSGRPGVPQSCSLGVSPL